METKDLKQVFPAPEGVFVGYANKSKKGDIELCIYPILFFGLFEISNGEDKFNMLAPIDFSEDGSMPVYDSYGYLGISFKGNEKTKEDWEKLATEFYKKEDKKDGIEHKIVSSNELLKMELPEVKIADTNGEYVFTEKFKNESREIYWIDKDRCKTEKELVDWLCHLAQKRWWSEGVARQFKDLFYKN